MTTLARFEKEPEFRWKILQGFVPGKDENKEEMDCDISNYMKFLNSFEGLSNVEKCDHKV